MAGDAVAPDQPFHPRIELEVDRERRAVGAVLGELPHDRRSVDGDVAEVRRVALEVVDDAVSGQGLDAVGMLEQREVQWKVWPPSITIVWPVTKSEPGPHR